MNVNHSHLAKLGNYITDKYGIVINKDQAESLRKYIIERMQYLNYHYFDDYFSWLLYKAGETEWEQFVSLITNNETYFYREPNQFRILDSIVLEELMEKIGKTRKIRIWSCGCSSGEEAYSIAICIKDKYGMETLHNQFEIIASDLDQSILKIAKAANYGRNSFRVKEHAYISSNFTPLNTGRQQLNDQIRSSVKFFRYNVCEDIENIPELIDQVDVLFFRNVSIYFQSETLRKVHNRLQNKINKNGFMFVASCETMLHDLGKLKLSDLGGSFVFKKSVSGSSEPVRTERKVTAQPKNDSTIKTTSKAFQPENYESLLKRIRSIIDERKNVSEVSKITPDNELILAKLQQPHDELTKLAITRLHEDLFEESISIINGIDKPDFTDLSVLAYSYMSLGKMDLAVEAISKMKKLKEFNPVGYLFEGLAYKLSGNSEKAIEALRKAIYLDLNYSVPHFHLAGLYQSIGKSNLARNEYELTLKQLEKEKKQLIQFSKSDISLDYIEYATRKILQNTASVDLRERAK